MTIEWLQRTFDAPAPLVSDEAFARVEQELGIVFPADYRAIVREHQGAMPIPNGIEEPNASTAIERLYHFEDEPYLYSIMGRYTYFPIFQDLPATVIPIAAGLGGDYICLDFREKPDNPTVVVLLHDGPADFVHLADSFTDLLDLLMED